MALWHGLAKLRMHTDATLDILDEITTTLGNALRQFSKETCSTFATHELKRETAARTRNAKSTKCVRLSYHDLHPHEIQLFFNPLQEKLGFTVCNTTAKGPQSEYLQNPCTWRLCFYNQGIWHN
jgi:hypothetical protein